MVAAAEVASPAVNEKVSELSQVVSVVCNDEAVLQAIMKLLEASNVTTVRALSCLSPSYIAAATVNTAPPDGQSESQKSLWKGTISTLLEACRKEAEDQLQHAVDVAKADLHSSSASSLTGSASFKAKSRDFTSALQAVARKLGSDSVPANLVPPQKVLELLRLRVSAYVDFVKYLFMEDSPNKQGSGTTLAESLEGVPMLIKSFETQRDSEIDLKGFPAKWSRAFLVYSIAVLTVQEDIDKGQTVESPEPIELEGMLQAGLQENAEIKEVTLLELLSYMSVIISYAADYNWKTAAAIDRNIRLRIDKECRSGASSLAKCFTSTGFWHVCALEAIAKPQHALHGSGKQESTGPRVRRPTVYGSSYEVNSEHRGFKRNSPGGMNTDRAQPVRPAKQQQGSFDNRNKFATKN